MKTVQVKPVEAGFDIYIRSETTESVERVPASVGDSELHERIRKLGLARATKRLLNGEKVALPD